MMYLLEWTSDLSNKPEKKVVAQSNDAITLKGLHSRPGKGLKHPIHLNVGESTFLPETVDNIAYTVKGLTEDEAVNYM